MASTQERADTRTRLRALLQGSGVLAVCIMAMNVSTFGFTFTAARLLGPEQYGGVGRMMALLLMISVLQLGLQTTSARRVSAAPGRVRQIERTILSVSYRAGAAVGLLALVLSPLCWRLLRLDSIVPALLIAVCAVPLTVMGGQAGILQGERRWRALALVYLANGVPRLVVGTGFMLVRPTEGSAMAAVALCQFAPALVGWWALRHRSSSGARGTEATGSVIKETFHGSVVLLAFFVLSNIDIILAGNILSGQAAGLYAAGLIVTKMVLFLPQVVVIVAFPSLAAAGEQLLTLVWSLIAVTVLGLCCSVGAWLFPGLVMLLVGGEYEAVEPRLWQFALLGTLLAILQLLVYSVLARQQRSAAYVIWAGVGVLIVLALRLDTLGSLLTAATVVDAVLVGTLLALSLWHLRHGPVPRPR